MNKPEKPNILLIHADQHRFDCIGACGNQQVKTPNIDSLITDGVLYKNSFCPYPVCTPSRYSLITGLYPHQHMGWRNVSTITETIDTFPRILKKAGYKTAATGKMHFTPTYLDVGFEEMYLAEQLGMGRYDDDYHRYLKEEGLIDKIDLWDQEALFKKTAPQEYRDTLGAMVSDLDEEHHSTTWIGQKALEIIDKWGKEGNMLMTGFIKPHRPFDPPEPWTRMYNPDDMEFLPGWTPEHLPQDIARHDGNFSYKHVSETQMKQVMAYYYASISQIDFQVGKMISLLKQKGLYHNTLIIYTSDHGEYLGFHHILGKGNNLYDPLAKVPLIIKYPGLYRKGETDNSLCNNPDVTATIISAAGAQIGVSMRGKDLTDGIPDRNYIFTEESDGYMVRSRTRKLLLCESEQKSQFFNLENDPLEMNNLLESAAYKNEVDEYKQILLNWILFEARTPVYKNENAPIIHGANVPPDTSGRKEMIEYFTEKISP
ncbi:MAG: sulfatase-like hydrolase/transferase [Treponema sp.]|nr:sulfatase-like hydrolase/transferase [Treponema sp.]